MNSAGKTSSESTEKKEKNLITNGSAISLSLRCGFYRRPGIDSTATSASAEVFLPCGGVCGSQTKLAARLPTFEKSVGNILKAVLAEVSAGKDREALHKIGDLSSQVRAMPQQVGEAMQHRCAVCSPSGESFKAKAAAKAQ